MTRVAAIVYDAAVTLWEQSGRTRPSMVRDIARELSARDVPVPTALIKESLRELCNDGLLVWNGRRARGRKVKR